jgi:preprotein translocase subunit SecY
VIPVIFATSVLLIPSLLITAIPSDAAWIQRVYRWIDENLGGAAATGVSWWYILILFTLIIFFTYFYTAIQFDPEKQAEMIQRQGGFVPGVRPGRQTARHLGFILNRITLPGSIFLATIAILPAIAGAVWGINIAFSGVSILIVVGVALETMKQIESQLTMRNYEGILT